MFSKTTARGVTPSKKKRDKNSSSFLRQKTILLVILLIFSIVLIFGKNGYLTIIRLKGEVENLNQQIKRLESKNKKLATDIKLLKTDPTYIESQARRMGMTKDGEKIIKFVPEKAVSPVIEITSPDKTEEK